MMKKNGLAYQLTVATDRQLSQQPQTAAKQQLMGKNTQMQ